MGYQSIENDKEILKEIKKQEQKIVDLTEAVSKHYSEFQMMRIETDRWHRSYLQYVLDNTDESKRLFRYLEGLNLEKKQIDAIQPDIKIKINKMKN
jgi:uncharacterized protein Yka (UPF0111/DUF47 family)